MVRWVVLWVVLFLSVPEFCRGGQSNGYGAADSVAAAYHGYSMIDLDSLAGNLTRPFSTQKEKFRAIYRWICDNIGYDHGMYLRNRRMRSKLVGQDLTDWNSMISKKMFVELARHRRTVCTGYAWLVKELAVRAGISCVMVDGYGRNALSNLGGPGVPNHSWNAVQLDGLWYLCDATWSAGVFDMNQGRFVHRFNEGYFLAKPEVFVLNHYPLDIKWALLENPPTLRQFLDGALAYNSTARFEVQPLSPQGFEQELTRGDTLRLSFTMPNARREMITMHIGTTDIVRDPHVLPSASSDRVEFRRRFASRGTYAVHVMVNMNTVLTYRVRVR